MKKRILSIVLVLVMVLGLFPALSTNVGAAEEWRRWAQSDSRWKSISLGNSSATIGSAGCAVTAITKLILQSGFKNSDSFDVSTLGKWLNSNGGYTSSGGIYFGKPAEMISGFEFGDYNFSVNKSSTSYESQIMKWVKEGYHVLLGVKSNGHYIAVDNAKSIATGRVYIMDSLKDTSKNADILLTNAYATVSSYYLYSGYAAGYSPSGTSWTSYPSYCTLSMNVNGNLYKEPYSLEENKISGVSFSKGQKVTSIELVENKYGNFWYKIQANGKEGYIYSGSATVKEYIFDDYKVQLDSISLPDTIKEGESFAIAGKISTKYNDIYSCTGFIYSGETRKFGKTVYPKTNSFSLAGSAIDKELRFDKLGVGEYTYKVEARIRNYSSNGTELSYEDEVGYWLLTSFKVVKKTSPNPNTPSPSPQYTVSFNTNGGDGYGFTKSYEKGTEIGSFPNTYLRGYNLEGWYTEPFGGEMVASNTKVNGDMTVYAHWTRSFNKITFDVCGGDPMEPVLTESIDSINADRASKTLVLYNESGATANTNKYGCEIAVDSTGKIVATRNHGSEERLTVPEGGFVLSGHNQWSDELGKYEGKGQTIELVISKGYEYVGVDYSTGLIRFYDSYNNYLANDKYVEDMMPVGELPTAFRYGYVLEEWSDQSGITLKDDDYIFSDKTVYARWTCSHMEYEMVEEIFATCTEDGWTRGFYCVACGAEIFAPEIIPATGHNFGEWEQTIAPGAGKAGEERRVCLNCGEVERREIAPNEHIHSYTGNVTAPTCTDDGYTTYTCTCGESYKDNYVEPRGHDFTEWHEPTVNSSLIMSMYETRFCLVCGYSETREKEQVPDVHNYVEDVIAPTCTEKGRITNVCVDCGLRIFGDYIPATGHDFQGAYCVNCGARAPYSEWVDINYRKIKIVLNGEEIIPCDGEGQTVEPFIMNSTGTTYLPLRAVSQALGLNVSWNAESNTVDLYLGGTVKTGKGPAGQSIGKIPTQITYRNIRVFLDGRQLSLVNNLGVAVEPFILNSNSSVYLPLRIIGEALGLKVNWDGATSTVYLNSK